MPRANARHHFAILVSWLLLPFEYVVAARERPSLNQSASVSVKVSLIVGLACVFIVVLTCLALWCGVFIKVFVTDSAGAEFRLFE